MYVSRMFPRKYKYVKHMLIVFISITCKSLKNLYRREERLFSIKERKHNIILLTDNLKFVFLHGEIKAKIMKSMTAQS